ncbi:MAG: ABC transporter permease [Chloroflexi bacterium]|nr:MAG: ABC transporter permease [Chloroflexota bacterium]
MAAVTDTSTVTTFPTQERRKWAGGLLRSYYVRKVLKTLFTAYVVTSFIFFLIRLLPGNPIEQMVSQLISQAGLTEREAYDQAAALFAIDFNQPLHLQYLEYLGNTLRGDLGNSILSPGATVVEIILRFLPWTIFSVGMGLILSFMAGMLLGMLMAYRRDTWFDHIATVFASIFSSVPNYLIGLMMIVWLGIQWRLVPIAAMRGALSPNVVPGLTWEFFSDALFHAALPVSTYFITTVGGWMLAMKSSTISTLGEDYVTVAKARGLTDWRITTAYVGRNASLPLFTQLALSIGFVVGGSILIESIFVYQGIGLTLSNAINRRDYTVMQGIFLVITLSVIFANFFADMLYSWLDPRIKLGSEG